MSTPTRPVEIHIGCLTLHGLTVDDADTFSTEVRHVLTTLVERGDSAPIDSAVVSPDSARPVPVTIEVPTRPVRPAMAADLANTVADRDLAHRVAEGVYRSLGGTP